jgi:2-polyprenyl-3-methyl-5-hydroxy-6-metoxy-1,4-benzoquinol methylase
MVPLMTEIDPDEHARRLAARSIAADNPTGWFEDLYTEAVNGAAVVPWDRPAPNPLLAEWAKGLDGTGKRALVVGFGLGMDSEFVASLGFDTVAFDVSETAVRTTMARFPDSPVTYVAANLLDPPAEWRRAFDLVVESLTVQSMPQSVREEATVQVGQFVAPGGTLIVIAGAYDEHDTFEGPPWPLTAEQIEAFAVDDLEVVHREQPDGRWRVEFRKAP